MTEESRSLRNAFLPQAAPAVSGFDIAAGTATHEQGPGATAWGHTTLASGHPACFLLHAGPGVLAPGFYLGMGMVLIQGRGPQHETLGSLMADVNQTLARGARAAKGQILECGILAINGNQLLWSSAGNVPGGLISRDGRFRELGSQGPPLGVMEGFEYRSVELQVSVGDAVIALSKASPGLFKGTADLVAGLVGKPVGEVVSTVHRAIRQSQGDETEVSVLYLRRG